MRSAGTSRSTCATARRPPPSARRDRPSAIGRLLPHRRRPLGVRRAARAGLLPGDHQGAGPGPTCSPSRAAPPYRRPGDRARAARQGRRGVRQADPGRGRRDADRGRRDLGADGDAGRRGHRPAGPGRRLLRGDPGPCGGAFEAPATPIRFPGLEVGPRGPAPCSASIRARCWRRWGSRRLRVEALRPLHHPPARRAVRLPRFASRHGGGAERGRRAPAPHRRVRGRWTRRPSGVVAGGEVAFPRPARDARPFGLDPPQGCAQRGG